MGQQTFTKRHEQKAPILGLLLTSQGFSGAPGRGLVCVSVYLDFEDRNGGLVWGCCPEIWVQVTPCQGQGIISCWSWVQGPVKKSWWDGASHGWQSWVWPTHPRLGTAQTDPISPPTQRLSLHLALVSEYR